MLHLIHHSKVKNSLFFYGDGIQGTQRLSFTQSEDTLTASVFSRLSYLPSQHLWNILNDATKNGLRHAGNPGELLDIEFWPHWKTGDLDRVYVEPDVLLRFENVDLLVEAKKHDDSDQQTTRQLETEIRSYGKQLGHEQKKLVVLAVSGTKNSTFPEMSITGHGSIRIATTKWRDIQYQVALKLQQVRSQPNKSQMNIIRVLEDILLAFSLHGYLRGQLLETLPDNFKINNTSIINLS